MNFPRENEPKGFAMDVPCINITWKQVQVYLWFQAHQGDVIENPAWNESQMLRDNWILHWHQIQSRHEGILYTPPKLNIAPEKWCWEDKPFLFRPGLFSGAILNFRSVCQYSRPMLRIYIDFQHRSHPMGRIGSSLCSGSSVSSASFHEAIFVWGWSFGVSSRNGVWNTPYINQFEDKPTNLISHSGSGPFCKV